MEIFAFNENAVGYEDQRPEPQLRSFDDINLDLPKSAILGVAGVAAATAIVSSSPSAHAVVGPGDRCAAVSDVQSALNSRGFNAGGVDSVFGLQTANAVRSFQAFNGLSVDGVVGPRTADALGLGDAGNSDSPYLIGNSCGGSSGADTSGTVSAGSGLTVRTGPGIGFGSVGSYGSGATVFFDPTSRTSRDGYTWVQVTSGTYSGRWVAEDFLGSPGSGTGQEVSSSVTAGSGLVVRTGPGTGFGSVGSYGSGATVYFDPTTRTSRDGYTWVEVTRGTYAGRWVAENFLGTGGGGGASGEGVVSSGSGLVVRTGPGTGFGSVGSYSSGATVSYDPTSRTVRDGYTWVRVTSGVYSGRWVAQDFLS